MCEKCAELQADLDHGRAIDQAHIRGGNAFWEGKPITENPYKENWDARQGTPEWRGHLQHGVWDDAWRRSLELQLLQEVALAAKEWMVSSVLETGRDEILFHSVEKYETSGCAMPDGWPREDDK